MDIDPTFEANAQLAHAREPDVSTFHDPAMTPQAVVALDPLARDPWRDASRLEVMATAVDVVGLVSVQLAWPASGAPRLSGDRRQGIDQLLEYHRVVPVGPDHAKRQGDAIAIDDQVPLAAKLAAIGRVRPGVGAPGGRPRWPRPGWPGSGPACRPGAVRPTGPDAGDARRRRPASPATAASRSCRCRSPVPGATPPTGRRCAGRRQCR